MQKTWTLQRQSGREQGPGQDAWIPKADLLVNAHMTSAYDNDIQSVWACSSSYRSVFMCFLKSVFWPIQTCSTLYKAITIHECAASGLNELMHHQAITSLKAHIHIHCEHFSFGIFIKLVSPVFDMGHLAWQLGWMDWKVMMTNLTVTFIFFLIF